MCKDEGCLRRVSGKGKWLRWSLSIGVLEAVQDVPSLRHDLNLRADRVLIKEGTRVRK